MEFFRKMTMRNIIFEKYLKFKKIILFFFEVFFVLNIIHGYKK